MVASSFVARWKQKPEKLAEYRLLKELRARVGYLQISSDASCQIVVGGNNGPCKKDADLMAGVVNNINIDFIGMGNVSSYL